MEESRETYIIAEVGQNHNGDMDLARQLIDIAAMPVFDKFDNRELLRVSAVKFTKRDLSEELTVDEYNRPYDSPHSFGRTYGEHREKLELTCEQHSELEKYAHSKGLQFVETLTSPKTLTLLEIADVDIIKVASRDLTNLPLLSEIAKTRKKVILSTGMGGEPEIDAALAEITRYHDNIAILHCVSQYPAAYEHLNLLSIQFLQERYPYEIGLSDHSIGIAMAPVAVALGAKVIEKHITLNRAMKGSDQQTSLEPDGLWRMVRDIRNVERALGKKSKPVPEVVRLAQEKLERSIAADRELEAGHRIVEGDLCLLSPGSGLRWSEREKILGRIVRRPIRKHTLILLENVENDAI